MTNFTYLLLLETSAITETDANTWQAIAKLGECLLPEIVAIDIKNIANGKSEGNESTAKQFQNLLPRLNWQITPLIGKHPELVLNASQNLSRKSRLILNVAQSAIGVATAHPQRCVVLISNEILLRDRIAKLKCQNLAAIPSAIARQWSRTNQAPPIVQQLIKNLELHPDLKSSASSHLTNTIDSIYAHQEASPKLSEKASPNIRNHGQSVVKLMKFGLTTTFLVTILLIGWRYVQPQQFQQLWEKTGLPPFPKVFSQPQNK